MEDELKTLQETLDGVEANKYSTYKFLDTKRKELKMAESRVTAALEDLAKFRVVEIEKHIEMLEKDIELETQAMHDCYASAEESRSTHHISEGNRYSEEAQDHKFRREEIRIEIGRMKRALVLTGRTRGMFAPWVDEPVLGFASPEYRKYDDTYRTEYKTYLGIRDDITILEKNYSDVLDKERKLKDKITRLSEQIKAEHDTKLNSLIDESLAKYGLTREQCKIVIDEDDNVQAYFGGFLRKDGLGHGHVTIKDGNVTYHRPAFGKHGPQNFTDGHGSSDTDIE